ncbi:zinc finger protein 808-like isoform X2 [Sitodiplosis mosellana]|uniref:zinc finger protein 808-like isoform X2 n=1 Tax=Sitodiplosis mosellana TaxID=263140 RepID=UPI002444BAC9|nr:zinc finger protein 808-like isoform X2 [Sitodiplosis mosellana]
MNIPTNGIYSFKFDLQDLCRICGTTSNDLNSMFDDDSGSAYDFASKINEYLPITVRKSDYLPQRICSMCASTLLSFHQLYIICQSNNTRFLQSLEGEAYEHHVVKSQVVGDTSELLELQSSFSREIENEILNMHESKEINEAESEIAANAAVKELERIGSAENISLVDDAADVLHSMNDEKDGTLNQKKSGGNNDKDDDLEGDLQDAEIRNNTRNKLKKVAKSPKKNVKNLKAEILKENITRSKSNKTEKTPVSVVDKDIKENNFVENKNQISLKTPCDYCSLEFTTKALLVEHVKDSHNDLIFHCEMCDDYVARVDLISHMLNHAIGINSNSTTKEQAAEAEDKSHLQESPEKRTPEDVSKNSPAKTIVKAEKRHEVINGNHKAPVPKSRAQNYCSECDKTFADSGGFKYHINSFHKKIKKYECDICGNHFSCKRVITNHLRGVHMKERIFECNQCAKKFSTDSALYMHKKIHENVFKCVCEVCDRKFRSMSKLKIHITSHTKEKNYFCEICQRGFAVRNNLTKHMLTHSKLFNFKCDKCSYVANQRRYLAEHTKRSHKT